MEAKLWGDLKTIQENLKKTIGSGVEQIWKFENNIESSQCIGLDSLNGIEIVERLIVTYDSTYFLNSSIKEQIKQLYPEIPSNYHWHTISINELEYFLPLANNKIFEILEKKRLDFNTDAMDFQEYCIQEFPTQNWSNPYLNNIYEEFFSELGCNNHWNRKP